jgi:hypothetical protein
LSIARHEKSRCSTPKQRNPLSSLPNSSSYNNTDSRTVPSATSELTLEENLPTLQPSAIFIAKHGYLLETTGPDASSQNGRGKRPHRMLTNMVCCMLYSASLGAEFWADALTHAAYLYNRTLHDSIGKTPEEAWTGHVPDIRHIRRFGSSVTVRKPGRRPTKADPHCYHGIFL